MFCGTVLLLAAPIVYFSIDAAMPQIYVLLASQSRVVYWLLTEALEGWQVAGRRQADGNRP